MADLSQQGADQYWSEYKDPMIYRVLKFMESVESWTIEQSDEFEQSVTELGEELEHIKDVDMSRLGQEDLFIRVACALKASRALRLLQALDTAHPGSASKLLSHAEDESESTEDWPGIFLRRNIVFERLRLLGRVFSAERFALVLKALEGEDDNA